MKRFRNLRFWTCDDWLILALDEKGIIYFVDTESWPEWADLPAGADQDLNAPEKYILPVAFRNWESLGWKPAARVLLQRSGLSY
jgi:hypothetical protein